MNMSIWWKLKFECDQSHSNTDQSCGFDYGNFLTSVSLMNLYWCYCSWLFIAWYDCTLPIMNCIERRAGCVLSFRLFGVLAMYGHHLLLKVLDHATSNSFNWRFDASLIVVVFFCFLTSLTLVRSDFLDHLLGSTVSRCVFLLLYWSFLVLQVMSFCDMPFRVFRGVMLFLFHCLVLVIWWHLDSFSIQIEVSADLRIFLFC